MEDKSGRILQVVLSHYTQDLSAWVMRARISPLQGRSREVLGLLGVIQRSPQRKNNAVLVGKPDPDRFAIITEMVRRIATINAQSQLPSRHVLALNLDAVLKDCLSSDLISQRLSAIFETVHDLESDPILFVDQIHRLVGGELDRYPMDVAPLLKSILGRHEVQMVGTSTLPEYQTYIERDPALNLRFQHVFMREVARNGLS